MSKPADDLPDGQEEDGIGGYRSVEEPVRAEPDRSIPVRARRRRHGGYGRSPGVEKEWYSKVEAAGYLGVAEITITRYLQKGVLRAQRLPTPGTGPGNDPHTGANGYDYGRLRINKGELDRYLAGKDRTPLRTIGATGTTMQVPYTAEFTAEGARSSSGVDRDARDDGDESEVMTREEAALRLGVSWRTIKRYVESGKLRLAGYFKCSDSYTRAHVYRSEVERLLHSDDLGGKGAGLAGSSMETKGAAGRQRLRAKPEPISWRP